MQIRQATLADLDAVEYIEKECFPVSEAASRKSLQERLQAFSHSFLVLEDEGKLIGMINGCVCDSQYIEDKYYESTSYHHEEMSYQHIFGLDVLPAYQHHGYGQMLMRALIQSSKERNKKGMVLTCKKEKITFYEQFGYKCLGVSSSLHGGAIWYDMYLEL